jgi:hypothetical protein
MTAPQSTDQLTRDVAADSLPGSGKTMSKANDTSRLATFEDHDTLADTELDAVSGGIGMRLEEGGPLCLTNHGFSSGLFLITFVLSTVPHQA